ncbi:MAG: class I SAM-dependent RNA methyltransferase [Mycobacteriales bacterium]
MVLEVGPPAHGGSCVARHEGRVVFVRHALPGERVRARVTEARSSYWRADVVEVLRASPDRVAAPCRYAGPGGCGGCDWQHADPDAQRRLKADVVAEQLRRIAGFEGAVTVEELPGGPLGWRTRVDLAVGQDGSPGLHPHRRHEVVPLEDCLLAHPAVGAADVFRRRWPGAAGVRVVASGAGELAVLVTDRTGRVRVEGPGEVVERAAGRNFQVPAAGFWQVHPAAAELLAAAVVDGLGVRPGESAWDLFAGAGLFAAALAVAGARVTAVEADGAAARAARANLVDLGVEVQHARVDAATVDRLRARHGGPVDVVVLDPPRAGAGPAVMRALGRSTTRALAYVSCDPPTLARDLAVLAGSGWRLAAFRAFDAFPMTAHVECLALLAPST